MLAFFAAFTLLVAAACSAIGAQTHVHSRQNIGKSTAQRDIATGQAIDSKLLKAVQIGDLAKVKHLLARGANVNAAQQNSWTALMLAAQDSKTSVAKYLIEHGADVHRRRVFYNDVDALMLAAESGNVAICKMLIDHGVNVNETNGESLLIYVTGNSNLSPRKMYQTTKYLISRGARVNIKDRNGVSPLSCAQAAAKVNPKLESTVRLLKAAGAR